MYFSVIIPVYNVEQYLVQCIESILAQTFTQYEIILINDGSTDLSKSICDKYANQDSRVKVIHKDNGGQSSARNLGLKIANGTYAIFLDSDDFLLSSNCFIEIYQKIQETNADIVLYNYCKYYNSSGKYSANILSLTVIEGLTHFDDILRALVINDAYEGAAWAKSIKIDLLKKNQIVFNETLSCEDMDWNYQVITNCHNITAIDSPYVAYRKRDGSVTSTVKTKNLSDFVYTLEKWHENFLNTDRNKRFKLVMLGTLAKYYSNLLIAYSISNDPTKTRCKAQIKALSNLLEYGVSGRPKAVRILYRIMGFELTIVLLKIILRIRG